MRSSIAIWSLAAALAELTGETSPWFEYDPVELRVAQLLRVNSAVSPEVGKGRRRQAVERVVSGAKLLTFWPPLTRLSQPEKLLGRPISVHPSNLTSTVEPR